MTDSEASSYTALYRLAERLERLAVEQAECCVTTQNWDNAVIYLGFADKALRVAAALRGKAARECPV